MDGLRLQVLGYRNFNRKSDGKPLTVLTTIRQCTPKDNERGLFGNKSDDVFIPDEYVGTLTTDCIGQEVVFQYSLGGFGRPEVSGFTFKPWK